MHITKMQGLGNDYLYVYGEVPENISELTIKLSDRINSIGSDGMIFISKSEIADFKMRIFNADGSEARMCGNGIRCVGKYVYDKGLTDKFDITVETLSGIYTVCVFTDQNVVKSVEVNMGNPVLKQEAVIKLRDREVVAYEVNIGNPHAIIFCDDVEDIPIAEYGPIVENSPAFAEKVNVHFVRVCEPFALRMRVWERGSGVTKACGTGACAAAFVASEKGLCNKGAKIYVEMDGGILKVASYPEGIIMDGPAEFVAEYDVDENGCFKS